MRWIGLDRRPEVAAPGFPTQAQTRLPAAPAPVRQSSPHQTESLPPLTPLVPTATLPRMISTASKNSAAILCSGLAS